MSICRRKRKLYVKMTIYRYQHPKEMPGSLLQVINPARFDKQMLFTSHFNNDMFTKQSALNNP